jgi:hypothetical protein
MTQVDRGTIRADAMTGLTGATIVLPQGIAFVVIAGLPPEYGLFTAMIVPILAAIWGSSMVMVSGPTTAISAVLFATLAPLASSGTPEYVTLALTLLVGAMQLAAGLSGLGELIAFISHSVIVAFTAAAAVQHGQSTRPDRTDGDHHRRGDPWHDPARHTHKPTSAILNHRARRRFAGGIPVASRRKGHRPFRAPGCGRSVLRPAAIAGPNSGRLVARCGGGRVRRSARSHLDRKVLCEPTPGAV